MNTVQNLADFLQAFAPTYLAEEWDNVGLLVGDYQQPVAKVMTCLTITPSSAAEAIQRNADLIVTHHPMPFRSMKRITSETVEGQMLLDLIGSNVAIFSPHTAFDSAKEGINQRLAEGIGLTDIQPLVETVENDSPTGTGKTGTGKTGTGKTGTGRRGALNSTQSLNTVATTVRQFLKIDGLKIVGHREKAIHKVAVACGSAGELLSEAIKHECDALVLGETNFHTCLEAEARDIALILPGHYATERFAVEALAEVIQTEFQQLEVWVSENESDPLTWLSASS